MSEGTQLKSNLKLELDEFSETESDEKNQALLGTKLGEISDFEKSLYEEEAPKSKSEPVVKEPIVSEEVFETEEVPPQKEIAKEKPVEEIVQKVEVKPEIKQKAEKPKVEELTTEEVSLLKLKKESSREIEDRASLQEHLNTVLDYQQGDIIKGIVRKMEKSGILVDIQYKSEGYVPNNEFSNIAGETPANTVKPGDIIEVYIVKLETKEGYTLLSRKRAEYELAWNYLSKIAKSKDVIDIMITSKVEGGLVGDYKGIKGFVPASQVLKNSDEKLDIFLNQTLNVTVLQVERKRRKVIFSHKLARVKPLRADIDREIEKIEVGEVYEGIVSSIKDFGVFVTLNGVEGLVHISELSWARVTHPSEILKVGDPVKVFVLGVDKEHNKISLGMKQLQPDPWVLVSEKYTVGQFVKGKVTRIVSFGAFVQLEKDLEGLIHISELSYDHIEKVEDIVSAGQEINAKIIKLMPEEQKIGLTLRGVDQGVDITDLAASKSE